MLNASCLIRKSAFEFRSVHASRSRLLAHVWTGEICDRQKSMWLWWPTVSIDRSIGMASQIKKWSQVGGWAGDRADLCPKRHLSGQPIAGHHASRPYQTDTHAHIQGKGPRQFICPCLYLIQTNSKFSNSSSTHHSHLKTRPWTASSSLGSHLASVSPSKYRRSSGQEM